MTTPPSQSQKYSILKDPVVCEPPNWPSVTLSDALTWIAFRNSKDCDALNDALVVSPPDDIPDAILELANALAALANLARDGSIELTGKYVEYFGDHDDRISRAIIPAEEFEQFRQFDIIHDGLRRGNGFAGRLTADGFEWRVEEGSREAYNQIKVDRAALLRQFAPPPLKPMTNDEVLQWCRDWISSGKGNGEDKAWDAFKNLPRAKGLTRDDVFRPQWKTLKTKNNLTP